MTPLETKLSLLVTCLCIYFELARAASLYGFGNDSGGIIQGLVYPESGGAAPKTSPQSSEQAQQFDGQGAKTEVYLVQDVDADGRASRNPHADIVTIQRVQDLLNEISAARLAQRDRASAAQKTNAGLHGLLFEEPRQPHSHYLGSALYPTMTNIEPVARAAPRPGPNGASMELDSRAAAGLEASAKLVPAKTRKSSNTLSIFWPENDKPKVTAFNVPTPSLSGGPSSIRTSFSGVPSSGSQRAGGSASASGSANVALYPGQAVALSSSSGLHHNNHNNNNHRHRIGTEEIALHAPVHSSHAAGEYGWKRVENSRSWNNLRGMWGKRAVNEKEASGGPFDDRFKEFSEQLSEPGGQLNPARALWPGSGAHQSRQLPAELQPSGEEETPESSPSASELGQAIRAM